MFLLQRSADGIQGAGVSCDRLDLSFQLIQMSDYALRRLRIRIYAEILSPPGPIDRFAQSGNGICHGRGFVHESRSDEWVCGRNPLPGLNHNLRAPRGLIRFDRQHAQERRSGSAAMNQ